MGEETRLTRAEWKAYEARKTCMIYGHDWIIVKASGDIPVSMYCSRPCGMPTYQITLKGD